MPGTALLDYKLAVILAEMTDMCLGHRCHYQISKPLICILLRHVSGEVKLIKVMMSCSTKRTKLVICQTTDRDIGAGMNSDIQQN